VLVASNIIGVSPAVLSDRNKGTPTVAIFLTFLFFSYFFVWLWLTCANLWHDGFEHDQAMASSVPCP
jgi:hypothetical protein